MQRRRHSLDRSQPDSAPLRIAAETFDVAIVGGGFAGTAVAAGLARVARGPMRVVMFDRAGAFARGAAYSPSSDQCLLNVRAKAMGAFPDAEDDFLRYLRSTGYGAGDAHLGERFLPRRLYGDYLTSLLDGCGACGVTVERRAAAVSALTPAADGGFTLDTECATRTFAKTVVLAIGNLPPGGFGDPALNAAMAAHAVNPWQLLATGSIDPDAEVLIIGTGLSALDVMLHLTANGHRGRLTMLSRHARFPLAHASSAAGVAAAVATQLNGTPRDVLRAVRGLVRDAAHAGRTWHDVIDAIRSQTNRVWQSWTPDQQRQFNRHLAPLWEIHRHRAPDTTLATCDALRASDRLRVRRGRLQRLERTRDGLRVTYDALPGGERELHADVIIDCTGPRRDIARSGEPLINTLFARGLARPGELGMGFAATADGRLAGSGAAPLYALGTPLRGTFAETSAVREIRVQARIIAESIAMAHDSRAAGDGASRLAVAD